MKAEEQLTTAIRAKVGAIWIKSTEELRMERTIIDVCSALGYAVEGWTVTRGTWSVESPRENNESLQDPAKAMTSLLGGPGRIVRIFFDLDACLSDPISKRAFKDLHRMLQAPIPRESARAAIVVSAGGPPADIQGVTVIDWPLPDRETMARVLDSCAESASDTARDAIGNGAREAVIDAMVGLTAADAANALFRSLVSRGEFDPRIVREEKKRIVRESAVEWYEADPAGLDNVGGLDLLKKWLAQRRAAFSARAREYGVPAPRGILLLGVPGCGKSLAAKCLAGAWNLPLLRLDVGSLFGKFVGDSEKKAREALATAEAVSPCVLWIDEIEKAFSAGGGETDGGTSSRVFGTFLTWMQERKGAVFIVATANDIKGLPPEFLRAGRWDDVWFVDLPNRLERKSIAEVMRKRYSACASVNPETVSRASALRTGSEIEQAFIDAINFAFSDEERPVSTSDVLSALKDRVPLVDTMAEKISDLRMWAKTRARIASESDETDGPAGRVIE